MPVMTSATIKLVRALIGIAVLVFTAAAQADEAPGGVLAKIRQDQTIRIAYREDAPPFSYKDTLGEPAGLMVDLCKAVAQKLTTQLALPSLRVAYVPVTAADRFETIQQRKADLLCEATSVTLSRREVVGFSVDTFVDGASLMIRPDGPRDLQALAGRKVGVLAGTTTEQALRAMLAKAGLTAETIPAKSHAEGLAMLDDARISAYFADRSILVTLIKNSKDPANLTVADAYLTIEPYALAMLRGDEDFRLAVDRALSHIYRAGELAPMFARAFGANLQPAPILQAMYLISGLPD